MSLIKTLFNIDRHFIVFFQVGYKDGGIARGSMTNTGTYPNRNIIKDHVISHSERPITSVDITSINEVSKIDMQRFANDEPNSPKAEAAMDNVINQSNTNGDNVISL